MNRENLSAINLPEDTIAKGTTIYLESTVDGEIIKGTFQGYTLEDARSVHVQLGGAPTSLSFPRSEWNVLIEKTYPLPEQSDIEAVLFNAITSGHAAYGPLAQEILALMKGEVETPVIIKQFNTEQPPQA